MSCSKSKLIRVENVKSYVSVRSLPERRIEILSFIKDDGNNPYTLSKSTINILELSKLIL